jgi:hypothetical protein
MKNGSEDSVLINNKIKKERKRGKSLVKIGNSLEELLGLVKKEETSMAPIDSSNINRNPCKDPQDRFEFTSPVLYQLYFLQQRGSEMLSYSGGFVFYLFGNSGIIENIIIPEQQYLEHTRYLREYEILSLYQSAKAEVQNKEFYGWGLYTYHEYSVDDSNFDDIHSALIKYSTWKVRQDNHDYRQLSFIHLMYSNQIRETPKEDPKLENFLRNSPDIKGYILSEYPCGNIQIRLSDFKEKSTNLEIEQVKKIVFEEITKKIKLNSKKIEERNIKYKIDASIQNKVDSFISINSKIIKQKTRLTDQETRRILNEFIKYIIEKKTQNKGKESNNTKGGDNDIYI